MKKKNASKPKWKEPEPSYAETKITYEEINVSYHKFEKAIKQEFGDIDKKEKATQKLE